MKLLRLAPENTKFGFMRFRRVSYPFSATLSIISVLLFFFVGMNFGIDFEGGTQVELRAKSGNADIAALRGTAESLGLGDRVTISEGYVPVGQVPAIFESADALVLPYRSGTASQNALIAFQFGLPVIATRAGAVADAVVAGVNGLLCAPNDVGDLTQDQPQVGLVVPVPARPAGREHPGHPVERVDAQARVVGDRGQAGELRHRTGLEQRIPHECGLGLRHARHAGESAEVVEFHLDPLGLQDPG